MKIPNIRNLSFFGIFILIVLNVTKSSACSCSGPSFEGEVKYSDEIFIGKVIKVEEYKNGEFVKINHQEKRSYPIRYYFEVEKKWKGNQDSILIISGYDWSCSFWFDIGKRYLVYAKRDMSEEEPIDTTVETIILRTPKPNDGKGILDIPFCSRTTKISKRDNNYKEDSKRLDEKFRYQQRLLQGVNKKSLNNTNPKKQTIMKEAPNKMNDITKKRNNYWFVIGGLVTFIAFLIFIKERI